MVLQMGRKHCGKRRNCSLQAISPFPTVFSKVILQTRKNQGLLGKGLNDSSCLNPFPNKPWFLWIYSTSLLKTLWEKEKMLVTSIFSFSHSVFYSIRKINHHFSNIQLVVCKCFQFGHVRNSVVWERVKTDGRHCKPTIA